MAKFTLEEINLMCVFKCDSRIRMIEEIERIQEYIEENDLVVMANQIVEKLRGMGEEEYSQIELVPVEDYREALF